MHITWVSQLQTLKGPSFQSPNLTGYQSHPPPPYLESPGAMLISMCAQTYLSWSIQAPGHMAASHQTAWTSSVPGSLTLLGLEEQSTGHKA